MYPYGLPKFFILKKLMVCSWYIGNIHDQTSSRYGYDLNLKYPYFIALFWNSELCSQEVFQIIWPFFLIPKEI